ncbi:uncharacterized protein LOC144766742 [Lissotriton helveticus]
MLKYFLLSVLLTMHVQKSAAVCYCEPSQVQNYWSDCLNGMNLKQPFNALNIQLQISLWTYTVVAGDLIVTVHEVRTTDHTITLVLQIDGNLSLLNTDCSFGGASIATVTITPFEQNGECTLNLSTVEVQRVDHHQLKCFGIWFDELSNVDFGNIFDTFFVSLVGQNVSLYLNPNLGNTGCVYTSK